MKDFVDDVRRLLSLVEGVDSAVYHCACRRVLKLGISDELRDLIPRVRQEANKLAGEIKSEEVPPDSTRFGLIDVSKD